MAGKPLLPLLPLLLALAALVCAAAGRSVAEAAPEGNAVDEGRAAQSDDSWLGDLRSAYRVYSECAAADLGACLKLKLAAALDRAARSAADLEVMDGVSLVRDPEAAAEDLGAAKSEAQLAAELPRSLGEGDGEGALDQLLAERALAFLRSHTLRLRLPSASALDEGRGRKNKMSGLLLLPLLMGAMLIPLALGGLALLAGKALLVSKLALVLAAVIGLKKLLSSHHHSGGVEVVSSHHHGRSLDLSAAQDLAYRAHVPVSGA